MATPRPFWVAVVAGTLALSGCILFVNDDPSKLGSTCQFQGSDTACGKCVATTCVSALDTCCTDAACKGQLGWLDACAANADEVSCQELSVFAPALAACVHGQCGACAGSDGGASSGGSSGGATGPSCESLSDYCSCFMGGTPGGPACTPQTVAPGLCCADTGWPAAQTSCTCQPFSCTSTSTGASCALGTTSTGATTASGGACCGYETSCYCDDSQDTCSGGTQVSDCTVDAIGCGSGFVQVASCSN